jgi:hypothetical protein
MYIKTDSTVRQPVSTLDHRTKNKQTTNMACPTIHIPTTSTRFIFQN